MRFTLLVLAILIAGCATSSDYKKSYVSTPGISPSNAAARSSTPQVMHVTQTLDDEVISQYAEQGYQVMGTSRFSSEKAAQDQPAINEAKLIGADLVVILTPKLESSVTKQLPKSVPVNEGLRKGETDDISVSGSGDYASTYGNGLGGGMKTIYAPVTINRYSYGAVFFVKAK